MNAYLRELLINQIQKTLADSNSASLKKHPYLIGKVREILLDQLINPLLNKNYATGTGHVVDCDGNQSKEMDICIYSNNLLPPFFHSINEKLGMFPIESVLTCIEIKTTLNKATLTDAFEKFKYLINNIKMGPGFFNNDGLPLSHMFVEPKFDFFAFGIDSNKYTPEYILNIYRQVDENWENDPLITSICIAGSGWICYTNKGWYHMAYDKKNKINEEVIGYLCALLHDLDRTVIGRGIPRIGFYLSNSFEMDKIKNGKKIRNTWRKNKVEFSNTKLKPVSITILE